MLSANTTKHNTIRLELRQIAGQERLVIESIELNQVALIVLFVDEVEMLREPEFEGSLMVFTELVNSAKQSGDFLLFTSVSGIADDAGWELVHVVHLNGVVGWHFSRDEKVFSFRFSTEEYRTQIQRLETLVEACDLVLEPKFVVFPE